ncbi:hypothetical protein [Kytococcus sp. Marseille-QA3725]
MTDTQTNNLIQRLRMDALDLRRRDPQAAADQLREIARTLTEDTTTPRDGFDAATPYELCQRYAAGLITREALIDQLTRWDYAPRAQAEVWNEILPNVPGSFNEVVRAADRGLIDDTIYDEVLAGRAQRATV